jgi:hypothetical protein
MNEHNIKPIIIIGAGRSGTKFFRDILLASPEVCGIPYDVSYIWRYGNEDYPDEELPLSRLDDKKSSYIRKTIVRLSGAKKGNYRFLLEKTVGNTLRVPFVRAVFPDAKYIHLIRDGRAVTESAMRLWQQPPEVDYLLKKLKYFPWRNYRYAFWYSINMLKGKLSSSRAQKFWGPRYKGIERDAETLPLIKVCAKQWCECVSKASAELTSSEVLTVRYEALVSSPSTIEQVCEFIGIADNKEIISAYQSCLQPENMNKWKSRFSEAELEILDSELSEMLGKHGYN